MKMRKMRMSLCLKGNSRYPSSDFESEEDRHIVKILFSSILIIASTDYKLHCTLLNMYILL